VRKDERREADESETLTEDVTVVTIIPIEINEDLVRRGVVMAAAEEIGSAVRELTDLAKNLSADGLIGREELESAFARVADARERLTPVLDYARVFDDQWPTDDAETTEG
jgi:hypothetical protein